MIEYVIHGKSGILSLFRIFYALRHRMPICFLLFITGCYSMIDEGEGGKAKVGIVFDAGGKDDKSFNTAAWEGAKRAEKDFDILLKDVEPGDISMVQPAVNALTGMHFDIIIGVGFITAPPIFKVAEKSPSQYFAVVDVKIEKPNIASLVFEEHEGAFLVGFIAARCSKSGRIGFVGGMDVPLIHRFSLAYEAGAKYADPASRVFVNYAGVTPAAWVDPTKGKELALSQYSRGADVIFAAAGATGLGVFDAAEEQGKLVIGCDSNQNWIKPGHVLTSMLKRTDVAVYRIIEDVYNGRFRPGIHTFNLENNGIDFAVDAYNEGLIPAEVREEAGKLKKLIIDGTIAVPDYYETLN